MNTIKAGLLSVLVVCVAGLRACYLPRAISIILGRGGGKSQFLNKGNLVTDSFGSVIREVRTDCLRDDVNSTVDIDWCGWASDRLCDLGSHPFSCRCQCPGMEGGLLLFPL